MRNLEAEIVDIFSSAQGEGIFVGARQVFIRFKRCNMNCVFCDEPTDLEPRIFTALSLMRAVDTLTGSNLQYHSASLTGGEPLIYSDFLKEFLPLLKKKGLKSYLETNGTLPEELCRVIDLVDIVAMDFKLPSSTGDRPLWEEHFEFLKVALKKNVFVKAVVTSSTVPGDVEKAVALIKKLGKDIPFIIQPVTPVNGKGEEVSKDLLLQFLDIGLRNRLENIRVIPQVHKILKLK